MFWLSTLCVLVLIEVHWIISKSPVCCSVALLAMITSWARLETNNRSFSYSQICQSKMAFFDWSPNRIPTGGSCRKTRLFRLDPPVEKISRNSFFTCFFNRIVYPTTKHTPTRPHGHTSITGTTQQYHTRRRPWRGYHCCCFSQQVSVAYS